MRLRIAAFLWGVDLDELGNRLVILDRREKPEHICAEIQRLAETEPFALVIVDTFAAFFDGDDVNNAVQAGEFMRRCRPLTQIPGAPAVLVSAHPVKNASEDQLIPYGSGAILNEVDGNLTLWKSGEPAETKLHWQGKLRGLEFQPLNFRFETTGCPDVLDVKGRQIELPTMLPATQQSAEERENAEHDAGRALLRKLMEEPGGRKAPSPPLPAANPREQFSGAFKSSSATSSSKKRSENGLSPPPEGRPSANMLAYRTPRYDRPQSCRSYRAHDRRYAARGNPSKCRAYQRHDMRHETPIVPPYRPFSLRRERRRHEGRHGTREATLSDSPDLASEILENLELNRRPTASPTPALPSQP